MHSLSSFRLPAGKVFELSYEVEDREGFPLDPQEVALKLRRPDSSLETYIYGQDSEITRLDVGHYVARLSESQHHKYYYEWQASFLEGKDDVAAGSFFIEGSRV